MKYFAGPGGAVPAMHEAARQIRDSETNNQYVNIPDWAWVIPLVVLVLPVFVLVMIALWKTRNR